MRVRKKARGQQNAGWMAAQRLAGLLNHAETYPELSRRLGLSAKTMRAYYRGEMGASVDAIATAVRVGGVNAHWLLTGDGPRYREEEHRRGPEGLDPLVAGALEKAREVVADLERAAGGGGTHGA